MFLFVCFLMASIQRVNHHSDVNVRMTVHRLYSFNFRCCGMVSGFSRRVVKGSVKARIIMNRVAGKYLPV